MLTLELMYMRYGKNWHWKMNQTVEFITLSNTASDEITSGPVFSP